MEARIISADVLPLKFGVPDEATAKGTRLPYFLSGLFTGACETMRDDVINYAGRDTAYGYTFVWMRVNERQAMIFMPCFP